jgi:hypothetical protein
MKIDYEQLRREIRTMTRDKQIYLVLKEELKRLGYWKKQPRGKAFSRQ